MATLPNIVLASASPRRKELLAGLGYAFETIATNVDEVYPDDLPPHQVPEYLAKLKANALAQSHYDAIVLAADTIVLLGNRVLGKPQNEAEALEILAALSGTRHTVITGVCLQHGNKKITFSDHTEVHFAKLSTSETRYYVQQYKPYDKAGAYGVQEWIGYVGVEKLEGSFYNVMGLPVRKVYEALCQLDPMFRR